MSDETPNPNVLDSGDRLALAVTKLARAFGSSDDTSEAPGLELSPEESRDLWIWIQKLQEDSASLSKLKRAVIEARESLEEIVPRSVSGTGQSAPCREGETGA